MSDPFAKSAVSVSGKISRFSGSHQISGEPILKATTESAHYGQLIINGPNL